MELGPPVVLIRAPLSNRRWDVEPDLIQVQTDDLPAEHATFHTLVVNEGGMRWRELKIFNLGGYGLVTAARQCYAG